MRGLLVCVIAGFILSGCATTSGFEKKLASLNGITEADLIRSFGTPQQVYETDGSKFLTFTSSRFVMIPSAYGSMGNTRSCQATFEISQGVVVGSTFKGNDCRA